MFPKVTVEDIDKFENEYIGSAEEKADVLDAYTKCKGEVPKMMEFIMFAEEGQESRIIAIIDEAIAAGEVVVLSKYEASKAASLASVSGGKGKSDKKRKVPKGDQSEASLAELILSKNNNHGPSVFESILAKYGNSSSKKSNGAPKKSKASSSVYDISDEDFERTRNALAGGSREGKSKK
jgi:DnaJ family protein C protein 9